MYYINIILGIGIVSEYIIGCKQLSLKYIHDKGRMQFLRNTLMGINREKTEPKIHYQIQEWKKIQQYSIYCRIIVIIQLCDCY